MLWILDNLACSEDVVKTDLSWNPFCFYDEHPYFVEEEEVTLVDIWKFCVPDVFMVAIYESEIQFKRLIGRYYQCAGGHFFFYNLHHALTLSRHHAMLPGRSDLIHNHYTKYYYNEYHVVFYITCGTFSNYTSYE